MKTTNQFIFDFLADNPNFTGKIRCRLGHIHYYENGLKHRGDGPAVIRPMHYNGWGRISYYFEGKQYDDKEAIRLMKIDKFLKENP